MMTPTIGLDYARVDNNRVPDIEAVVGAGVSFAYIRGFQRLLKTDVPDITYKRDGDTLRQVGITVGAYFFPCWDESSPTPKAQVAAFKRAAPHTPGRDLPPALDIEFGDGLASKGLTRGPVLARMEQFVREIEDQFGCLPMIYSSWNQWWSLGAPAASYMNDCPLWIKTAYEVKVRSAPWQGPIKTPHLGVTAADPKGYARIPDTFKDSGWFIQQFQGDAKGFPGFSSTVDINRLNTSKQGPHIKWIQRRLGVAEDGIQGPKTSKALAYFQQANGVPVTGNLDAATLAALCWSPRRPAESWLLGVAPVDTSTDVESAGQ
jgi:hypothetical protein